MDESREELCRCRGRLNPRGEVTGIFGGRSPAAGVEGSVGEPEAVNDDDSRLTGPNSRKPLKEEDHSLLSTFSTLAGLCFVSGVVVVVSDFFGTYFVSTFPAVFDDFLYFQSPHVF